VLDDRLDGKDLEWARDHLRRCETCRERVEEFREMLLRVGRLPKATVGSAAMDEAYALSVPERLREEAGMRSFDISPAETNRVMPSMIDVPPPMRPEVTSIPDLMSELEREIFHDEPVQDHPTPLTTIPDAIDPTMDAAAEMDVENEAQPQPVGSTEEPTESETPSYREVPIDSHQNVGRSAEPVVPAETDWARLLETIASAPEPPVPGSADIAASSPGMPSEPPTAAVHAESLHDSPAEEPANRNVIFDQEPALTFDGEPAMAPAKPAAKSDTGMRLFVGLGAAACVLLAAVLYEGSSFFKSHQNLSATARTATASVRPTHSARASASATIVATPAPPPATVLYTLGNGVTGNAVFRIRPGTAVAGYTRLVFDMHGSGLPTMLITRTDGSHVQVIFKNTTVTGVPANGIVSTQIAAVEPGVQTGPDGSFTIDLARPVRVTAFTLAATGGYAWRLVVDLHTA